MVSLNPALGSCSLSLSVAAIDMYTSGLPPHILLNSEMYVDRTAVLAAAEVSWKSTENTSLIEIYNLRFIDG